MDLSFLNVLMPMLLKGLKITLEISLLGILFGFLLGGFSGFVLGCRNKAAKFIINIYLWIIRGTPIIVQALYVYFVVPKIIGYDLKSNLAGIIVISLNSGAFIAEIVRGSLEGIDPGQKEAGLSLGLTPFQTLWHVIVPPAFRSMLPALFNQFIITVKDTAILSVIVVNEITKQIQNYAAVTFNTIQAYTAGAVFYLVIISVLIIIQKQVERRVKA
ncbi:ABC transporter permease subunit [Clostridium tyrobutyricum]|jgi:glutamine transport system permease protein|uniref:Glutamine transport system permease protein glnP (TC 3.A.1.3.2) n=1 Tax=Clostridium tyrobutyricum DIVETGP TaxID=1408889 RepID=W6NH00_CLOTY|nr:amino acid ABC transporter permease [Clostridium tyrobutyricum]AND83553.1 glutamine transport system permease protein [Clostridium tyrobutyricum]ANP68338.1 amino acid ABC transporter permease [Clostridium tyrobutyricum]MBR9648789.1 amino acid ABC transporter permease [Clostridium tyrobutyricum]MBV4425771.1 amino acid ABC transporter permease [Clostridium tyrobutyricum]MBV4433143.1 amino acid ABC transporter permease [Clostridium tyrobutyricum]